MTSLLAQSFECQEYKELNCIDEAFPFVIEHPLDWIFQLKYDGIWAKCIIENDTCLVYSKTGQLKHSFKLDQKLRGVNDGTTVLIGEFMYGSQWSKKDGREGLIYVFDCVVRKGEDLSTLDYERRHKEASAVCFELGNPFVITINYSTTKLGEIWGVIERTKKYEGLILRKKTSTYFTELYKIKVEVEDDFVAMDFYEGQGKHAGRLGGIEFGQWKDGVITKIMDVGGGYSDAQRQDIWDRKSFFRNSVWLVQGKARFDSGAFRHPNVIRRRDDKRPEDCIFKP